MAAEGEGKNLVGSGGWDNPHHQQEVQATPVPSQGEAAQEVGVQGIGQELEGEKVDREEEGGKGEKDDIACRDLVMVEGPEVVVIEDSEEEDIYYSRQRKPSKRSRSVFTPIAAMYYSCHALPDANRNRSLVFGGMNKPDWDSIHHRRVQLVNFLASLEHGSENSEIASLEHGSENSEIGSKSEGGKLTDHSK